MKMVIYLLGVLLGYSVLGEVPPGKDCIPPTITPIRDTTWDRDEIILFTVGDDSTPADALLVTGESDNPELIPPENIQFGGSSANRGLIMRPAGPSQWGTAKITVTVTDQEGCFARTSFLVHVPAQPPWISSIPDQIISPAPAGKLEPIEFKVNDAQTFPDFLEVSVSSSHAEFIPNQHLFLGGRGQDRHLTIDPVPAREGFTRITIRVRNAQGIITSTSFHIVVAPKLQIAREGSNLMLEWTGDYVLQQALEVHGPFEDLPSANSPYAVFMPLQKQIFFRLRSITP
jgi:hypothetical protein